MSEKFMTIREMCEEFQVTARTLRFYEAKELISPIRVGQTRQYTHKDRGRLKLILQGKRFGFALEEIRQLLDLYNLGDQQYTQFVKTYEKAKERLNVMISQRDELTEAIEDLRRHLDLGKKELDRMQKTRMKNNVEIML
ncbi:MAG: MerR family DNA-binding transcriptional regulator [Paracoccaceae bacterium]|jgi:DNA-binding transcriptional MerR regulator|nr:MerR family DNA-binding transcriptional regulator [Paracoccaceae bacterium]